MAKIKEGSYYVWVIRSKHKYEYLFFGHHRIFYFKRHSSIKSPYFTTTASYQVRFFNTKEAAEQYLYQKRMKGHFKACQDYYTARIKIWVGKDGYMDFWKNSRKFRDRDMRAPSQK